jgi:hypothetical protein
MNRGMVHVFLSIQKPVRERAELSGLSLGPSATEIYPLSRTCSTLPAEKIWVEFTLFSNCHGKYKDGDYCETANIQRRLKSQPNIGKIQGTPSRNPKQGSSRSPACPVISGSLPTPHSNSQTSFSTSSPSERTKQ